MIDSFRKYGRRAVVVLLCELLVLLPALGAPPPAAKQPAGPAVPAPVEPLPLQAYLVKSYLTLFKISPELHFTDAQYKAEEARLTKNQASCVHKFKEKVDAYNKRISADRRKLHGRKLVTRSERHALRCKIQDLRFERGEDRLLADHGVPIAYQNMKAKLELIQNWPTDYKQIQQELADGAYRNRRWGDVKDIGFRVIAKGQSKDIRLGEETIQQLKQEGMLPPEVKNKAIVSYVRRVAMRVASHSDLHVPLHLYVVNSNVINAFSFPGGFVFVNLGLLRAVDNESELAGVIGHEIGHIVARHGHKLMERATLASIFEQAGEVAAMVMTGGIASLGEYYALQYGFEGLGMMLNLKLLGVSREYELQADQLGIQYAWNAGYDPTGFIRFFDKMATREGYVNGVAWFYDHPPFYQRMVDAMREIDFLPKKSQYIVQTSAFLQMKKELKPVVAMGKKKAKNRPSLIPHAKGCMAPRKLHYKPGDNIDNLCGTASAPGLAKK
jgi:Zn-dependent protease with chaperone function